MPSSNPNIRVVVTESEKQIIEAKAKQMGKSVSSYLKYLALSSPGANSQPVSQDDPRVSQLEQMVMDIQSQMVYINHKLANLANPIANPEIPATIEEVSQPECDLPLVSPVLPIADLVARLAPKHIELSTTKTDRGRANTLRDLPATLAKIKPSNIAQWTADRDPEGLTWQPTDETREHWRQVNPVD
ncbi:plasmid mobilization protein [Nostoc sp.]|uniref:plasmid mobilization protein n=1 Tax=Nostoc sp. TaxID=1180 RepID=UPI002FF8863B